MRSLKLFFTLCVTLFLASIANSQEGNDSLIIVKGKASILMNQESFTKQAYENLAYFEATQNAIDSAFGTSVLFNYETYHRYKVNGRSITDNFDSREYYIHTYPNGEWVKDIEPQKCEEVKDQYGKFWMNCSVIGYAREIAATKVQFKAYTLDGINIKINKTTEFINKEQGYLYFKSPSDGYLICFYDDMNSIQRCIPYNSSKTHQLEVKSNKDYLLFSKEHASYGIQPQHIDEIEFQTERQIEYNQIYLLFSPSPFPNYLLEDSETYINGYSSFKQIKREEFYKWLQKQKLKNSKLQLQIIGITINE